MLPTMKLRLLLVLAVCSMFIDFIVGDTKTWTKDTNFDNPNNWNGGGVVCANDRKVFHKDLKVFLYIQQNESLQELVLSDNMVITIGEGVILSFNTDTLDKDNAATVGPSESKIASSVSKQSTTPRPACTNEGRVVRFTATSSSWFDPHSWSTEQTRNDTQRFMLDLESVPCSKDRVVFPSRNSFLVNMESQDINAGSMLIHNEELISPPSFNNYWAGDTSSYEFVQRSKDPPTISGAPCGDDRTCQCADRYSDRMKVSVCRHRECPKTYRCQQPVLPEYGQCCQLCGAKLMVTVDSPMKDFDFEELHRQVVSTLAPFDNVLYSVGPLVNQTIEVILMDREGDGNLANSAVCSLTKVLMKNETSILLGGISGVVFNRSDGVDSCYIPPILGTTSATKRQPKTKWDNLIIGVSVAIVLVCILLVFIGVFLYRRKFAVAGKNEMELGNVGSRTSQGFDNPVYDSPLPFEDSFTVTYDDGDEQVNGFENAMYSAETGRAGESPPTKKAPLEDPYAPVIKKGKKKSNKKQKEVKHLGFDNPVYALDGQQQGGDGTGSMVSVPLDEDENQLPEYVEHDGTGFANPIATGLSEEMMAPPLPPKQPITSAAESGFDNPLFGSSEDSTTSAEVSAGTGVAGITVHVNQPAKKKKGKKSKSKNGGDRVLKEQGFGNPLYDQEHAPQDFYQPETPGEDNPNLPERDNSEDGP